MTCTKLPVTSNTNDKFSELYAKRKEIAFIDPCIDDYQTLVNGVNPGVEVYVLDSQQDGVWQITNILQQQTELDAVHIISHGNVGYLLLGNSVLSTDTLSQYQQALFSWQVGLKQNADILIYGCDVAKGAVGKQFIQQLALITDANIAASDNLTGNIELGGDWKLNVSTSDVVAGLVLREENLKHFSSTLVTNTLDFTTYTISASVTATHATTNFGTINFKVVSDANSTGTAFGSLTLASAGAIDGSANDFFYTGNNGEYFVIYTDGREVDFQSLKFGSAGSSDKFSDITAYAYKDGTLLGNQTLTPSGATFPDPVTPETVTFTNAVFENADEIRLIGTNGAFVDVVKALIDDLIIADPILPNASPAIAINAANLAYTENAAATQIDSAGTLTDSDGDADWNGGTLKVQITANNEAADQLTITDNAVGTINTSGTNILNGGTTIGTLSASEGTVTNGTALTITFNASATNALVQQVVRAIHYSNTSDDPGTSNRTITFTATDKNAASVNDARVVVVTSVNDEPTLTATGSSPTFSQGGSAASLFSGSAAGTVESGQTFSEIIFTVTNVTDGSGANELLSIDSENIALTNANSGTTTATSIAYSVALAGSTATVTLTKAGMNAAAVQTLIDNFAYSNSHAAPSSASRVVTLTSLKDSGGTANSGDDTNAGLSITSTVTVVPNPTITSATYDYSTNQLVVTGTNLVTKTGAQNDVDISLLTLTGEGGATYTLTGATDVEIDSATQFTVNLSGTDIYNVEALLNKDGTSSDGGTTFNLAAADNWMAGTSATPDISDTTSNGITVSNVAAPTVTSATYDASTGALVVTGTNLVNKSGAANDIDVTKFTLTGEAGVTRVLTSTNVELTSATTFTVTLNSADKLAVNGLLNKNGVASDDATTFNLAAADNWAQGAVASTDISDATGNGITVSNVAAPTLTSATYDASTGSLVVTGTNFVNKSGVTNDVDVTKLTLTGEASATRVLTSTNVEVTSATAFTVTLNSADKLAVNGLLNKNGVASDGATTYNLAAADNWIQGAAASVDISDAAGNGITVSNVAAPTLTSATYDASTGILVVTGANLVDKSGATNDVDVTKLTLTGDAAGTRVLTSSNVEITSATAFTVTLNSADKLAVNGLLNKDGTSSDGATTYNLAAADNWIQGAAASVDISDAAGNGITVSNVAVPTVSSTTYDASTGVLVVTGTNFVNKSGATNDVDVTKLMLTGEGSGTRVLTSTNVEITSATAFTVTLNGADKLAVNSLLNKNGTASGDATTFNLAAADNWMQGAAATPDISDATGNGITVNNVAVPAVTSATYDASTGALVITGTNFFSKSGAANDVDASLLTITGEAGATYTLTDTSDVELTSITSATVTLSSTDQLNIQGLLNKAGASSGDAATYNLAAADNWLPGAVAATDIADATGNGITVSNIQTPTVTSATYDSDTGILVVTGTNLFKKDGATNDVDISTLTLTGGTANATYVIASTSDVEITSATSFSITLAGADKTSVDALLDTIGTVSGAGSTYNLAAADNWLAGADAATNIADATSAVTVSINPNITSATYNAGTGALVVAATNIQANGGGSDIDASTLTFTGEGGATYTLTNTSDVNRDSATQFTLALSATDKAAINLIVNKNGTASTSATTYNVAAADDWNTQVTVGDTSDATGNGLTASGVVAPTITSSTYDAVTGALVVTGSDFLKKSGAANDIDASLFTFTGEGGDTYTLTDSADVEITSGTAFTVTLSTTDKAALNQIINKDGTASTDATTYNIAAAEDWAVGADAAVAVVDATGNGVTVSNVAVPTITSSTYNTSTGVLVVTGAGFLKSSGATNDIDASLFTFKGEGAGTYTLIGTADVEITSGTQFTITLDSTDKAAVNLLLEKNGIASTDATTYNLAAAEDWAAGAAAIVNVVDATSNWISVTIPAPSSDGGGGTTTTTTTTTTETVDGSDTSTTTETDGTTTTTVAVVEDTREEDPTTPSMDHADIPVVTNEEGDPILTVSIPTGVGLSVNGQQEALSAQVAIDDLIARIEQKTDANSDQRAEITFQGRGFLASLADDDTLVVQTITLLVSDDQVPNVPIIITGSDSDSKQALVIDVSNLPSGTIIQLDNVAFAAIVGAVRVVGGAGQNTVVGDNQNQFIVLGADDDVLFGGGGDDTVGSLGGDDRTNGDAGNDIVYGGTANDIMSGGTGNDQLNGGLGFDTAIQPGQQSDYQVEVRGHDIILTHSNGEIDTITDAELIQFASGSSLAIAYSDTEAAAHHLAKTWLGRDLTAAEGNGVQNWVGADVNDIIRAFHELPEASDQQDKTNEELLAGLDDNPDIIQLDVDREFVGVAGDDQGFLPLGLALNADGGTGHDVLQMLGERSDVHLETVNGRLELTRLEDGAMLSLINAEAIVFDSGETVFIAHNTAEGILGRLFQSFYDRDATAEEWQSNLKLLADGVSADTILDGLQSQANLSDLSDTDYVQALYSQTFGRQANTTELDNHLLQLTNGELNREWLAVEVASSDEAVTVIGNVIVQDGWV